MDPFNFMDKMYQFFVDRGKIVFSGILDFMVLLRSAYIQTDKKMYSPLNIKICSVMKPTKCTRVGIPQIMMNLL